MVVCEADDKHKQDDYFFMTFKRPHANPQRGTMSTHSSSYTLHIQVRRQQRYQTMLDEKETMRQRLVSGGSLRSLKCLLAGFNVPTSDLPGPSTQTLRSDRKG